MNILCEQKGAALVLVVMMLPVMLGMGALVVDVGNLYTNRAQLSVAADAAALAGAQELPKNPVQADAVARNYAQINGRTGDKVDTAISANNRSIQVTINRTVPSFFAGILGKKDTVVSARSTAQVSIAASVPWIVPFVIPKTQAFDYTNEFIMRMYDPKRPHGQYEFDYMNVGIENTSFQDYINYLKYGYQKKFQVGQNMQYLGPSSGGRQSVEAFYDRTVRDSNTDYTKATVGSPRVMLIPIVEKMLPRSTAEGTSMKVIGFAGFFLSEVHKGTLQRDGNYGVTFWARGRFLKDLNVGPGDPTTDPAFDFGVRTIQLVE